ncbi:hypothetical protein RJ639_005801 [Escallonia herrerae]|uniref:Uncharacterized protein n=1 Tax=Escallonia herrerae TaxID=1293975 RepID=A0AA88VWW4_9ASTE|nr:hypothetical protein RJ639_005801 [Escallonia herrerae]
MPFRPSTASSSSTTTLTTALRRCFSAAASLPKLPKIPSKYKPKAILAAQKALTEYLHATRTLPFTYAEQISKNSPFSLSNAITEVDFSPSTFSRSFQRFLRYHPINEFEFLYESIGIDYEEICGYLQPNKFFLSEDSRVFKAACELSVFGFPWIKLGRLFKEEISIFGQDPAEINERLRGFKEYGFNTATVIGICLAFPFVLGKDGELGGEVGALFDDLRRVLVDFDLIGSVEGNVDAFYEVCKKIRLFYDLGCEKGRIGELLGRSKDIFVEHSEELLAEKIGFFCKLAVRKEEIGSMLLSRPEILKFDLESPVVSVLGFLKHCGLEEKKLMLVVQDYPYVLGRNKLANVPRVMRSLDLHEWFFSKVKNGDHHLLTSYCIGGPDQDLDKDFTDNLVRIHSSRTRLHMLSKLDFFHSIGYGENKLTVRVLNHVHGTSSEIQERFECLLHNGIEFSKVCKILSRSPKVLNQDKEFLERKIKYLCKEMGSSLSYLDAFPAFLCYDLDNRIIPRYKFHMWLMEIGWCTREYAISSMIATSEKQFIARISAMHPDAPKKWLEHLSNKDQSRCCGETVS